MFNRSFFNNRFNLIYFIIALVSFAIVVIRAKTTPFTHDETATFYFIVQNGHYMPFYAHLDTNNHILNSLFTHVFYTLFGSSKFILRLPNVIFYLVLLIGVFKLSKHLKNNSSKALLVAGFLISYHWLTFFSVSRGYGLSFASILIGFAFLLDYLKTNSYPYFIYFCFWLQLAIAASLILMPVFCILLALIIFHQLLHKQFFRIPNLITLAINGGLIFYWVLFSSYLKNQNGLTHGAGDSYWQVTFVTLIYMITGSYSQVLQFILVVCTLTVLMIGYLYFLKSKWNFKNLVNQPYLLYMVLFILEFIAMYLMKVLMHVNYPEDRTAIFFYITLVLFVVFLTDELNHKLFDYFSFIIALSLLIHFAFKLNFRKHELYIYDTFPTRFYDTLLKEQKNNTQPITIGGHRCREFIYGFMNYRSEGALNAMDAPELLHMNCDYLVAKAGEKPFYERYYDEIDSEPDWDFRLLKRKYPIENKLEHEIKDRYFKGHNEFYELLNDTNNLLFPNKNPIRADFTFEAINVPSPFEAWLVIQIDSVNGNQHCFKRSALNWIKLKYSKNEEYTYSVVTGTLPLKYKSIKAFLWNIKGEEIEINFKSLKLYQMYGKGINYVAPIYF